ncbi:MAG: MSMEG_4193 family putative phosphomutase [Candidatus Promineofilum sp.]|jgi:probable phosphoglycerate mutase|nr:MSMEG_4193 family putative phosphomutase [Promineifilum sp.]
MATIILVRHGENDWSKNNKLAGWLPGVHLNETGHRQAEAVAQRLAALPIKAVYSSPLTRCVETAAYIADTHRLSVQHLEEIGEVRYGEWEGKKISKLARKPMWHAVQFFPSRARFPGGETLGETQFRAVTALEETAARHEKEMIVVVSHADVIRLLLAHYLGVHIDLFQRLVIAPASVSILALSPGGLVRVLRLNDDGPLHAPTTPDAKPPKDKKKNKKKQSALVAEETTRRPADNGREPPAALAGDEEE